VNNSSDRRKSLVGGGKGIELLPTVQEAPFPPAILQIIYVKYFSSLFNSKDLLSYISVILVCI
jgi:hypothetical protein